MKVKKKLDQTYLNISSIATSLSILPSMFQLMHQLFQRSNKIALTVIRKPISAITAISGNSSSSVQWKPILGTKFSTKRTK